VHFRRRRRARPASTEWQRRPWLSLAVRSVVVAGPAAGSLGLALLLSAVLPKDRSAAGALLWIAVILASSLFLLFVLERLARRLLPLAALLNVSLLFPDKAPARFAVVRRIGTPRDLRARLEAARSRSEGDAGTSAMQEVMELALALSVHDKGTRGHSERVRVFADLIADELKIDAAGRARLRWAALLHDVGKLEVPPAILNKPGRPDEAEWEVLHRHPAEGARIAQGLMSWLGEWGPAVIQHHERWDGTGYPNGLRGNEISLAARIVSVADTYEVMTAPRPYKRPMSVAAARRELVAVSGTQLDPMVVRAFLNVSVGRLWRTVGVGAWVAQLPLLPRVFSSLGQLGSVAASGAATMGAVAVVGVSALVGPAPLVHSTTAVTHSSAQASPGASGAPPGASTSTPPAQGGAPPSGGSSPVSPQTTSTGQPTGGPTASAGPSANGTPVAATPTPTTAATATPTVGPTPTATPTPTPTPTLNWWQVCPGCSDQGKNCTSYCIAPTSPGTLPECTTYCEGNALGKCTTHCYSQQGDNGQCLSYCSTPQNNPKCTTYCRLHNNPLCTSHCVPATPKCQPNCAVLNGAADVTPAALPVGAIIDTVVYKTQTPGRAAQRDGVPLRKLLALS